MSHTKEWVERTFQAKGTEHVEALKYKDFGMERNRKSAWLNCGGVGGASEGLPEVSMTELGRGGRSL